MTKASWLAAIEALPESIAQNPTLSRLGRHCTLELRWVVGDDHFYLSFQSGVLVSVERGVRRLRRWQLSIEASLAAWEAFWSPRPAPGYQDLFALVSAGHARLGGDIGPLLANLRFVKEVLQLPGERTSVPGPEDGAEEPIVGRYLRLSVAGERYRIYYESAGEGIPLLCLHTAGSHSSQYRHLMCDRRVTERFRVIAFDLPWHGKSDPPVDWQSTSYVLTSEFYESLVLSVVDTLNLQQPVIMGCSMGGRLVVKLALAHGERLRAVIGLEGSDHPSPWYDDSWLEREEFLRGDFCAALVSGLMAPQSPSQSRWETLWHYCQSGPEVFKGDMNFYRTDSEYRAAPGESVSAACPVYLMTGEYDYSCTPELTVETAERIPGAKAIVMQELGHFPMSENPELFYDYLAPVLGEIDSAADRG